MEQLLTAKEYYARASFFELELVQIAENTEKLLMPTIGLPQEFTQATSQARIVSRQSALLEEEIKEVISLLNTFASLANTEPKFDLHPLLDQQLKAKIKPYLEYYDKNKNKIPDLEKDLEEEEEQQKQDELIMQEEQQKKPQEEGQKEKGKKKKGKGK